MTITEQNPEWEAGAIGPGARTPGPRGARARPRRDGPAAPAEPAHPPASGRGSRRRPGPRPGHHGAAKARARACSSCWPGSTRTRPPGVRRWRGWSSPLALTAGAQVQLGAGVCRLRSGCGAGCRRRLHRLRRGRATASLRGRRWGWVSPATVEAGFVLAAAGGASGCRRRPGWPRSRSPPASRQRPGRASSSYLRSSATVLRERDACSASRGARPPTRRSRGLAAARIPRPGAGSASAGDAAATRRR